MWLDKVAITGSDQYVKYRVADLKSTIVFHVIIHLFWVAVVAGMLTAFVYSMGRAFRTLSQNGK